MSEATQTVTSGGARDSVSSEAGVRRICRGGPVSTVECWSAIHELWQVGVTEYSPEELAALIQVLRQSVGGVAEVVTMIRIISTVSNQRCLPLPWRMGEAIRRLRMEMSAPADRCVTALEHIDRATLDKYMALGQGN